MKSIDNAQDYEKELTRVYNRFNKHFWNNELPEVIITFAPKKGKYGHVTSEPVWQSVHSGSKYELNISAYSIGRDPEDICETILHEQCHLYNLINDIEDTSDKGRYHNKFFKKAAQDHGLNVIRDKHSGWSKTKLDEAAKAYVKKLNVKEFTYQRIQQKAEPSLKRFSCPICGIPVVYALQEQFVMCEICNVRLKYMPKRKAPED